MIWYLCLSLAIGEVWRTVKPIYEDNKFMGFNFGNGGGMTLPDGMTFNFGGGGGVYMNPTHDTRGKDRKISEIVNAALGKSIDWSQVNLESVPEKDSRRTSVYHTYYHSKCIELELPQNIEITPYDCPVVNGGCDGKLVDTITGAFPPVLSNFKIKIYDHEDKKKKNTLPVVLENLKKTNTTNEVSTFWRSLRVGLNELTTNNKIGKNGDGSCEIQSVYLSHYTCMETCVSPAVAKMNIMETGMCRLRHMEKVDFGLEEIVISENVYCSAPNVYVSESFLAKLRKQLSDAIKAIDHKKMTSVRDVVQNLDGYISDVFKYKGDKNTVHVCHNHQQHDQIVRRLNAQETNENRTCVQIQMSDLLNKILGFKSCSDGSCVVLDGLESMKNNINILNKVIDDIYTCTDIIDNDTDRSTGKSDVNKCLNDNMSKLLGILDIQANESATENGKIAKTKTKSVYRVNEENSLCTEIQLYGPAIPVKILNQVYIYALDYNKGTCVCEDKHLDTSYDGPVSINKYICVLPKNDDVPRLGGVLWPILNHPAEETSSDHSNSDKNENINIENSNKDEVSTDVNELLSDLYDAVKKESKSLYKEVLDGIYQTFGGNERTTKVQNDVGQLKNDIKDIYRSDDNVKDNKDILALLQMDINEPNGLSNACLDKCKINESKCNDKMEKFHEPYDENDKWIQNLNKWLRRYCLLAKLKCAIEDSDTPKIDYIKNIDLSLTTEGGSKAYLKSRMNKNKDMKGIEQTEKHMKKHFRVFSYLDQVVRKTSEKSSSKKSKTSSKMSKVTLKQTSKMSKKSSKLSEKYKKQSKGLKQSSDTSKASATAGQGAYKQPPMGLRGNDKAGWDKYMPASEGAPKAAPQEQYMAGAQNNGYQQYMNQSSGGSNDWSQYMGGKDASPGGFDYNKYVPEKFQHPAGPNNTRFEKLGNDVITNNDLYCKNVKCPPNLPYCAYGVCMQYKEAQSALCKTVQCSDEEKCILGKCVMPVVASK